MGKADSYIIEEWWTKREIELVKDFSRVWTKKTFTPTQGFWIQTDGGRFLGKTTGNESVPEGAIEDKIAWDHEHCELCWAKISDLGDDQHDGFTDGKDWLCIECYDKYIVTRKR